MLKRRETREVLFTLFLLVAVATAVFEARDWGIRARLFPWAIGLPLLALIAALLVLQVARLLRKPDPEGESDGALSIDRASVRRGFEITAWLLAFLVAIWLLGFPVGGTLGTLAYLKLSAREKWPISLVISGGTALFFFLMINGLHTPFPQGTLFELIGGPS